MKPVHVAIILALPGNSFAGSSVNYALGPTEMTGGGKVAESPNYSVVTAVTPGGAMSSENYELRSGFAGQLGFPSGILLSAPSLTIQDAGTLQLSGDLLYDDGSSEPVAAEEMQWTITTGPIASVTTSGLATAEAVYEDSGAVVRGTMESFSAELALTVLNSDPDNFGTYAGDGLPDGWQLQYFGFDSLLAGQNSDPDSDNVTNLVEFANGTDPSSGSSGVTGLSFTAPDSIVPGVPVIDYAPEVNSLDYRMLFIRRKDYEQSRLSYLPQFSRNLRSWSNATTPINVVADDGTYQVMEVRFPVFIGGLRSNSKFSRLKVEFTAP